MRPCPKPPSQVETDSMKSLVSALSPCIACVRPYKPKRSNQQGRRQCQKGGSCFHHRSCSGSVTQILGVLESSGLWLSAVCAAGAWLPTALTGTSFTRDQTPSSPSPIALTLWLLSFEPYMRFYLCFPSRQN